MESAPSLGSSFHFTARFGAASDEQPRVAGEADLTGVAALIVDDNGDQSSHHLSGLLWMLKMKPVSAATGLEALTMLRRASERGDPFALVLTDCHMPEMDGFDLAE